MNPINTFNPYPVLSIAGFDGSGGAGLQADLKTFSALGCYATTVLTALSVQNTTGVKSIYEVETSCVEEQLKTLFEDISMKAIKIGMLHRQEIIESVATFLKQSQSSNIILDPVMVAKSGDRLLKPQAIASLKQHLLPLTTILTPNLPEASELLGKPILHKKDMEEAALELVHMGPRAVVLKGGHLNGDCDDCLCIRNTDPEIYWFSSPRVSTKNTHGTGCTFSAAITAFLARGYSIIESVKNAKKYLSEAILAGQNLHIGKGNGPVHHFYYLWKHL